MNYVYTFCDTAAMSNETMGDRLKSARVKSGFQSARRAALKHNWPPSTYAAHENGQNAFGPDEAARYAKAFRTTAGWLLTSQGPSGGSSRTKLLGEVGAGSVVYPFEDQTIEWVELPPGAPVNAGAVRVRGDSMHPRYFNGEILFFIKDGRPPNEFLNRECVIRLKDGGMMVKMIRAGSKRDVFNLESWSHETIPDQKIDWAAPVKWTQRT